MSQQVKNYLGVALTLASVAVIVAVFWFAASYSDSVDADRQFSVSGEGEVTAVPDVAQFNFSVVTEGGEDLGVLQEENSTKMNNAIEFVKNQGVSEEDIQTSGYNIRPRYQRYDCPTPERRTGESQACPPPEIVGYTVEQDVQVKVRDFDNVGSILSGVVENGANQVSGLSFTIDDDSEVRSEARQKAIEQAKEKARAIANQAGFRLGDLVSVNEDFFSPTTRSYKVESVAMDAGGSASPQVEPGSREVRVNVNLTYEIE